LSESDKEASKVLQSEECPINPQAEGELNGQTVG